ncbi:MAG: insulinase family protein [Deltaproteobacteria bacterium]|nr:insulinase family protein [Deltaproteobacteria bacterium]
MHEQTLKNGLKLIVEENHASRVVAAQVWVRVGSADELPDEAGLAHVHEHMLFKGTERRRVGEIASDIEAAGGEINAWTSFDETVYHVTIASREVDTALDILADAVQHSTFDADELARELEVVLEELRRGNDTPSRVASEMLFETAFEAHPYRRPVIGYLETVKAFTREKILAFYRKWYRPDNMCLVVVGDVETDKIIARAEALFESRETAEPIVRPSRPVDQAPTVIRVAKKVQDIQETHLGFSWLGTHLAHEDTPAIDVLSVLLGTGQSSRLYRRVKREAELVNDCYAFSYTPQDPGLLAVGAQIHGDQAKVEAAFRALLKETLRLTYEEPEMAEVEKARTIIVSDSVYQKETVQGIARKHGYFHLVAGRSDFEAEYYAKVRSVTPADVRAVATKYLKPNGLSVATLLPEGSAGAMEPKAVSAMVKEVVAELDLEHSPKRVEVGNLGVAKLRLENGATLLVQQDRSVPLVSVRAVAKGGLLAETAENNGVSHLVSELLVRGTESYTTEQIVDETDAMAGNISGIAGRNSLGLRGDFLKDSFERGLELFSSCLLEPTFLPEEIEKEISTQLEDIASRHDNLAAVAFDQLLSGLFAQHPYRMPTLGTIESVKGIRREHVVAAYRAQLRPDRLTIAIVGDVDIPRTVSLVESHLGRAAPHADAKALVWPKPEGLLAGRTERARRREKEQAHLVLGFRGVSLGDDRRFVLDVLSSVLGGQSGRLFLELRDRQSLAYSVSAMNSEGLDPGYFALYIGTSPDKVETAEKGMLAEVDKILTTEVAPAEVERAKRYLIGAYEIGLQRASARSSTMALNEAYGIGYDEHARYAERLEAVDARRIREVAREILDLDRVVRSLVSPLVGP